MLTNNAPKLDYQLMAKKRPGSSDLFDSRRKQPRTYSPTPPHPFQISDERLDRAAANKTDTVPTRWSDSDCPGLRFYIRKGAATFHVQFTVAGRKKRPMILIGERPEMTLQQARAVTKTIVELGKLGIDVSDGLEKRLVRELQEQGVNWRA
jgi:hypothetical protein